MAAHVQSMIAVAYVTDIDASRAFYELLGFRQHSSGRAELSGWVVMRHDQVSVLLAMTGPALEIPPRVRGHEILLDGPVSLLLSLVARAVMICRVGRRPESGTGAAPWRLAGDVRRGRALPAMLRPGGRDCRGGLAWGRPPGGRGRRAGAGREPGRRGGRRRGGLAEGRRDQRVELLSQPLRVGADHVRERRVRFAGGKGHADHPHGNLS
jgi:hypothetical protein